MSGSTFTTPYRALPFPARHLLLFLALALAPAASARAQTALVRQADLSKLSPSDFRDDELDLPYYLANFHRIANSDQPHNARIMESILSLTYFYTVNRPWNIYRGDPALRARLEAALEFWINSQNTDGRFSEYAAGRWGLAPTAFATKFMGES